MIRLYTFLVFIAVITVSFCGFFLASGQSYERTVALLVEQTQGSDNENIAGDIAFISQKVLNNKDTMNEYEFASVAVERISDTNILIFTTRAGSPKDIVHIENMALKKVFANLSKFYNLKKDVTFTIINKSDIKKTVLADICLYLIILFGVIGIFAGILLIKNIFDDNYIKRQETDIDAKEIFAHFHDKNFSNSKEDDLTNDDFIKNDNNSDSSTQTEKKKTGNNKQHDTNNKNKGKIEIDKNIQSKSIPEGLVATPGNLPVVDASDFGISMGNVGDEDLDEIDDDEPTEEELKKRLNQLLNGDL